MNKFVRALIAGYGAKKLGGGCFSTLIVFIIIYWALGTCNRTSEKHSELFKPDHTVISKVDDSTSKNTLVTIPIVSK